MQGERRRKGLAAGSWVAIQNCIMAEKGRPCVAIQGSQGYDTATVRHDTTLGAAIRATHCSGVRAAQLMRAHGDTTEGACDTAGAGPRYDATANHDTVQCARLGLGCALGATNPVLTQCTVLSHYLGHCS